MHYFAFCKSESIKAFYKHLIKKESFGIDFNRKDREENTPMAISIMNENVEFTKVLMKHQSSLEDLNGDGRNALHLCSLVDNVEIALLVVKKDAKLLNIHDNFNTYPHHLAVEKGNRKILDFYLQQKDLNILSLNGEMINAIGR